MREPMLARPDYLGMEENMANRIVLNTISYHGAGAIAEIPGELQRRGYKKVFVCTDPDLVKFGVAAKVTDLLDEAGIAYSVYSDIKPNPTIQNVTDGVEAFKAAEADSIVTIGGGSAMDTAKAIGVIITNPEFADVRSLEGVAPTKNHAVFTIAVPRRHRRRGHHQLRHHRRREGPQVRVRRHQRRPRGRRGRSRDDGNHARRPYR